MAKKLISQGKGVARGNVVPLDKERRTRRRAIRETKENRELEFLLADVTPAPTSAEMSDPMDEASKDGPMEVVSGEVIVQKERKPWMCTAKRTNGQPCTRASIEGSNVCPTHGGRAPQVVAKAKTRILMAADLAAAELIRMMSDPRGNPQVKLAAARDLLDRAKVGNEKDVQVTFTKFQGSVDSGKYLVDLDDEDGQ